MAGGKQSPRQKMINMMYLVLTAMLALNVSKDILKALTKLDNSLSETISTVENKNAMIYSSLAKAAAENPDKAAQWKAEADKVRKMSDELFQYISVMKDTLVAVSGGTDDEGNPSALDAKSAPMNFLLAEGGPKKAKELRAQMEAFREAMKQSAAKAGDDGSISQNVTTNFSTDDIREGDKQVKWEQANFGEYPLGAILPFLTDIQARVRNTESEIISSLQSKIGDADLKFTGVRTVVMPKSSYVTQGSEYEAEVFLAAFDDTQEPEIFINGEPLPAENISGGIGKIKFPANAVGEKKWGGKIVIKQIGKPDQPFDIPEQSYTVAPQSVVISPTKMNVLYRGVDNPIEIGVPGVDPARIRVSGQGVTGANGDYMANVTKVSGKEITISVQVEEETADGQKRMRAAGSKEFRIKGLPPAVGTIYKRSEGLFSKSAIANAPIEAAYEDFPFDLALEVTSFEVAIPGSPPERVQGNKMPSAVKTKIERLKPGQTVSIRNIKARGPKGLKVDRVGNISVDVN